jgi:hypothetical protein
VDPVRRFDVSRAAMEHREAPARQQEGAGTGVGLRRLDDEASAADPDRGGPHLDRSRLEVHGIPGQPAGLADAQAGGIRNATR